MASKAPSVIPTGYSFFTHDTLISDKGRAILDYFLKKAANRNPDAFDMYVYNDFYPYGLLDLIDKSLLRIYSKITKKAYDDAFYLLEALTAFFDHEPAWPMCDDGERTKVTNKAYGALIVALLSGLQGEDRLDKAHFPALEYFLKKVAHWGSSMKELDCKSDYDLVCKAIGEKLFKDKSRDELALEEAQLEEWIGTLPKERQEEEREEIEEEAEEDESGGPWYTGGKDVSSSIVLSRIWKEYKRYLGSVPTKPLRGPGSWDISTWSDADKKEFAFGDSDEEDD